MLIVKVSSPEMLDSNIEFQIRVARGRGLRIDPLIPDIIDTAACYLSAIT